jgi:hypothetical protein
LARSPVREGKAVDCVVAGGFGEPKRLLDVRGGSVGGDAVVPFVPFAVGVDCNTERA